MFVTADLVFFQRKHFFQVLQGIAVVGLGIQDPATEKVRFRIGRVQLHRLAGKIQRAGIGKVFGEQGGHAVLVARHTHTVQLARRVQPVQQQRGVAQQVQRVASLATLPHYFGQQVHRPEKVAQGPGPVVGLEPDNGAVIKNRGVFLVQTVQLLRCLADGLVGFGVFFQTELRQPGVVLQVGVVGVFGQ